VYLGKRDHRTVKKTAGASRKGVSARKKAAPKAKARATAAAPAPDNGNSDPGDFVVPFGSGIKGKKLRDLPSDKLDWVANQMAPFNDAGKQVQQKARQFQESLAAVS